MKYEIRPTSPEYKSEGGIFAKGRILIGRTESCDLVVSHESVSAVHAVLEIHDDKAIIYDMNSTNGTYVNDKKIIVKDLFFGDFFRLADIEFEILENALEDTLPPPPGSDEKSLPDSPPQVFHQAVPTIVFPEKHQMNTGSSKLDAEVIILFNDKVFSSDHLHESSVPYLIRGLPTDEDKNGEHKFIEIREGVILIHSLLGFEIFHLSDNKINTGRIGRSIELAENDLVRLQRDNLQIFIRNLSAGPSFSNRAVNPPNPESKKNLIIFVVFMALLAAAFFNRDRFLPKKKVLDDVKIIDAQGNEVQGPKVETPKPENESLK